MFSGQVRHRFRERLRYQPERPQLVELLEETRRQFESEHGEGTATITPPWVGDGLANLIASKQLSRCLEVGMATGSTAAYMLSAVAGLPGGGRVTSIDRAQSTYYKGVGTRAVAATGHSALHRLVEKDSIVALHELWNGGEQFDFIFLDGWKTFDHLAAELYVVARLLRTHGVVAFDDFQMPSVQRAVGLATSHYAFKEIPFLPLSARPKLFAQATLSAMHFHFRQLSPIIRASTIVLTKTRSLDELPVTSDWNFYAPF